MTYHPIYELVPCTVDPSCPRRHGVRLPDRPLRPALDDLAEQPAGGGPRVAETPPAPTGADDAPAG